MAVEQTLKIAIASAAALAELHAKDIIHRGIRPQAIRVHPDGRVELVARSDDQSGEEPSRSPHGERLLLESLPYVAPEQTGRMNRPVEHRADLYSLGVTLYEMLSGTLPFTAKDPVGWVHCHVARAPRPLSEAAPHVPPTLCDIVMKLLAKGADDRYQSARGLMVDLETCMEQLQAKGRIDPFPLGRRDVWHRIRIPSRLYGRDNEVAALLARFEQVVAQRAPEIVVVSGYSGIGKSVLVHEIHRPVAREHGFFVAGKFDEHRRDIPYATLGSAFRDLARQLLAISEADLKTWRTALIDALGSSGRLIADLAPEIELIIGPQPPVAPLPPSEAQNRLHTAFRRYLGVFAKREHPLVVFLDDLQWADFATLRLLSQLVAHPDMRDILLIGAYRDNEVGPAHPLVATLEELKGTGLRMTTLTLGPLPEEHLVELVADTLRSDRARAAPLAALLFEKTAGNPFFVTQFLTELETERLLRFDERELAWHWDLDEIRAKRFTDNVVDFMIGKLRRLPPESQRALMLAACVGSEVEAPLLVIICERTLEETHHALDPAVQGGLLLRRGEIYRFLHDRVQQAAYALIAEEQRGAFHLRVGRLLFERTPEARLDGRLFDVANHMNLGASLVVAPDERRRLAELNLRAGRRAKAGAAYQSAVAYLSAGAALLSAERWESDPALTHALHFELAESHYLSGTAEDAERLCSELLSRARTNADRADVYRLRIQIALRRVDMGRMIGQLIECLGLFGIQLSARPSTEDVTAEVQKVHDEILDCRIEDLLDRPLMQDPETMSLVGVLAAAYMGLFVTDREIAGLVVCQMVRLSVKHGTCPESAIAYSAFGAALCERLMAYEEGFRFGKLAYDITERFGFEAVKAEVCHHLGNDIAFWTHPFGKSIEYCRSGLRAALETGNVIYACINWTYIVFYQLARGDPLEAAHGEIARYRDFLAKLKLTRVMPTAIILERFVLNMLDRTAHFSTFSGDGFDQDAFEGDLLNKILPAWKLYYLTFKTQARVLSEDYREAFDAAAQAKGLVWTAGSQITLVTYRFSAALATAARYHELDRGEQEEARAALADHERTIRRWSETNPQNFLGMYLLVAAEISRLDGRPDEALTRYEAAANAFHASGFVHWEGLTHAIAARFFQDRSLSGMASACVREARACYERWGATGKVRQLDLRYADLLRPAQPVVPRALATSIEQLDTAAIIKATQALSSEVLSDRVLSVLMHLVIEHSGARRSCLVLSRDAQLAVAAQAETGRDGVNVRIPAPGDPVDLSGVPASVVLYTMRTGEKVIVDDASTHKTYFADEYVAREHVRSLLCIPVKRNDAVVGALYMDNNLSVGVFDARQLAVVELVTAQAAVSLENARLYEKLADENAKRQATEEKLREQIGIIDRQQQAIQQLSTPIIEVWDGVVVMPVVGIFDSTRAKAMIEPLLATVQRRGCRYAIIDLTGVDIVDTQTAEQVLRVVLAVRLLGAQGIVSGIRPDVARTIVALGVDLSSIVTLARLRDALVYCIRRNEATA